MTGFIGLHRCLLDKPIWLNSTPEQKTILITLLLMANHKEQEWEWKGDKFKAEPGQFVTSLESIVKKCGKGISIKNVRTAIERFEKLEFLANESTKTGRLITIVNWGLYQSNKNEADKDTGKEVAKNRQRGGKEVATNNNDNNDNNVKKKDIEYFPGKENLNDAMKDFVVMRKQIKKPMTDKAVKLLINKLNSLSDDSDIQVKILEQSTLNCWQTVYPLKEENEVQKSKSSEWWKVDG